MPPPPATPLPAPDDALSASARRPRLLQHMNEVALLRLLRDRPGLSRAALAEQLGLTRSTVGLLVQALIDAGWLNEDSTEASGARGRRPVPLRLDGRRFALIGVELAPDALRAAVVSVQGVVQHSESHALGARDTQQVGAQLCALVLDLVRRAQAGSPRRRVLGVGLGLPGAVTTADGVLRQAPHLGWRMWPVRELLQAALAEAGFDEVAVLVQNEADMAALGELDFGPRPTGSPLVYVSCGIGVGAGIVVDDRLFAGATGSSGEIGHSTLHANGLRCACGRQGCAEAYVGLRALAGRAGALRADGEVDRHRLATQLAERTPATLAAVAEAGQALGLLLHNLAMLVDPGLIVLGGETVALAGDDLVASAREVLERSARDAGVVPPALRLTRFGSQAVQLGAAAAVLRRLLQTTAATPASHAVWFSELQRSPRR